MKVLDIYGKKDLEWLTCEGEIVSKIMDDFFKNYPSEYRKNYDKNLEGLEIWNVDEPHTSFSGEYYGESNLIILKDYSSFIHELMHMSSCDYDTRIEAISKFRDYSYFDTALIEGMTENYASIALDRSPNCYFFEAFTASMLSNIKGLDSVYFMPNYDKFIRIFPNKRDIISLMYALNFYSTKIDEINNQDEDMDDSLSSKIEHSIRDVIDNLIDIQLSFKMDKRDNTIYGEKFMDLLYDPCIENIVGDFYDDYIDYANEQVNKRILGRK